MKNKGFTLIELLVVIAIIGLLSSIVLGSLNNARSKTRYTRAFSDMREIGKAAILDFDQQGDHAPDVGPAGSPRFVPGFLRTWPTPPCAGWTYDWENWNGGNVIRITLRRQDTSSVYYYCVSTTASCAINGGTAIESVTSRALTCNE